MSFPWAVLPPSTWGLPGPALLVDESLLILEPTDLPDLGFIPLEYGVNHPRTLPTAEVLRVDLQPASDGKVRLFKASETQRTPVDTWGLLRPVRPTRPAVGWEAREVLRPALPDLFTGEQLRQSVTEDGRLLMITGDLGAFWSSLAEAVLPARDEVATGGLIAWIAESLSSPSITGGAPPRVDARHRGPLRRLLSRSARARS